MLADTLRQQRYVSQALQKPSIKPSIAPPKIQTAYDLMKFRFDIAKIDSVLHVGSAGLLCIVGYKANLLLTRLCVRALLPSKYGGLNSPYALVVDAGNKTDVYQTVDFARQYGISFRNVLGRIVVSRTFTIYQLKSLLSKELSEAIQKYQASVVLIPGILDLFDDPNIKQTEAKKIISRIVKSLQEISKKSLIITSLQESKYSKFFLQNNTRRIILNDSKFGRISAELYDENRKARVSLSARELKLVHA